MLPIIFTYEGKEYSGQFSKVTGAADTSVYHLMIAGYYKGCLWVSGLTNQWVLDGEFADIAEGFGLFLAMADCIKDEHKKGEHGMLESLL